MARSEKNGSGSHISRKKKYSNPLILGKKSPLNVFVAAQESKLQRSTENVMVKRPNPSFPGVLHPEMSR